MCDNCKDINMSMYTNEVVNINGSLIYYIDTSNNKTYIKKCCMLRYYTGNHKLKPLFEEKLVENTKCLKKMKYLKLNNANKETVIQVYEFEFNSIEIISHPDDHSNTYQIMINRFVVICKSNEQYVFTTKSQFNKFIKNDYDMEEKFEYVYLLQDRTAVKSNEEVYKIGKTKQENLNRFKSYPKGINILLLIKCTNCDLVEKKIMYLFKQKYIHNRNYGNEYFEGNPEEMVTDIINIIFNKLL